MARRRSQRRACELPTIHRVKRDRSRKNHCRLACSGQQKYASLSNVQKHDEAGMIAFTAWKKSCSSFSNVTAAEFLSSFCPIGWLELGNYLEANEELEKITPQLRAHPDVLKIRYEIYAAAQKWNEAHTIAQALVEIVRTNVENWLCLAYSARRKPTGSIEEAKKILQEAALLFPTEETIFFNLACYDSQLGNLAEAKRWIDMAYQFGDRQTIQRMVLNDPDLEPLRSSFK